MCFKYIIKHNFVAKHGNDLSFVSHCLLYLCIWPVSSWFCCCKTFWTEIIGGVRQSCNAVKRTTFAVCSPLNNCTPLECSSANQIQAFDGPVVYMCTLTHIQDCSWPNMRFTRTK